MPKYDEFDLDLKNQKVNLILTINTQNTGEVCTTSSAPVTPTCPTKACIPSFNCGTLETCNGVVVCGP